MKVAIKFLLIALFAICCAYVGNAEVVVDEDFDNALDGEVSSESNKRELVEDLGGRDLKDEDHATEEVRDLGEERELWPWYHNIFHKKRKHYGKKKSNSKKKSSSSSSSSDGKKKKRRRRRRGVRCHGWHQPAVRTQRRGFPPTGFPRGHDFHHP
mmetsp:Transcript_7954/g.17806  ORF Transcript_7954/g.17806 Transcript_7954/m.17806 type:complete len:155 (+) Transcript_7954:106-570(+)